MRLGFRLWQQCLYRSSHSPLWLGFIFAFCLGYPYSSAQETIALVGSGSSVPAPLYAKWAEEYNKRSAQLHLRYLPLGTSEGIKQISHGSGDFGAGELPLTAKEREDGNLIEVPTILIAIVPIYNLPGVSGELRLSGTVLADIFLGNIKTWDSPSIAKLNPQLALPALPIKVVYRPGGKGSNYVFSYFLSKSNPQFRTKLGASASPAWPVGSPAERSSDMVEKVRSEPGSIGYVEAQYAATVKTLYAAVMNPAGHFVKASEKSIAAACQAVEAPAWDKLSASLIDAPGPDSYPITSFSWLYLRTSAADPRRAAALTDLLNWMFTSGQQVANGEGYVALPAPLQDKVKDTVRSLR